MPTATLTILPWVRTGAATAIDAVDSLAPQSAVAHLSPALTVNSQPLPSAITVRLRGPADVVGIDANQIVRTDPRPATTDFEPNCFPSIELDRADFPWLFTPARANADGQLRPWLCLVVVRKQEGVSVASSPNGPLPTLRIAPPAIPAVELPDLKDCWAWAHAQVATDDPTQNGISNSLDGAPELSLSRLICARILAPNTDYFACLVPTFDLGRKAGLGLPVSDADLTAANALTPAWSIAPAAPTQVTLPVYYQWEFRTGQGGDFKSLAQRLTPRPADGLGSRPIDISHPGFPASGATTEDLEGALRPIPPGNAPPPDPVPLGFKTTLASIINAPDRSKASDPNADPLLAPPIYGRWHAGSPTVSPGGQTWLDQLNLDPRWRVAAAFGTRVIQEQQDALMASAWDQAAELPAANHRMRSFQLSLAMGQVLYKRHISPLEEEKLIRIAAPAFGRLGQSKGASLLRAQMGTILPLGANRVAMRRIGRQRGPLSRRAAAQGAPRTTRSTWVASLNSLSSSPQVAAAGAPPPADFAALPNTSNVIDLVHDSLFGAFFVSPENTPVPSQGTPVQGDGTSATTELPGFFRAAALEHFQLVFPFRVIPITPHFIVFQDVKPQVLDATFPSAALKLLINAVVKTGDGVLAPTAPGIAPVGVETVMAAPSFPQPMYEPLREISQDLLLPGLDKVAPDSVIGLQTNRRFVEAYMVGLNHEMGRELLWRGYPTDQRGTYFKHFWGLGVPNAAPEDIHDLNTWGARALGAAGAPSSNEQFVLLLRSSLLRRYPNAIIYLAPALQAGAPPSLVPDETLANEIPPIFSGSMQPDVSFFGFPITTAAAIGSSTAPGYYVVIQEHPTEPRFGLDASLSLGGASHLAIGANPPQGLPVDGHHWGKNAAEMAAITFRLPVRMAIHASRLVSPA